MLTRSHINIKIADHTLFFRVGLALTIFGFLSLAPAKAGDYDLSDGTAASSSATSSANPLNPYPNIPLGGQNPMSSGGFGNIPSIANPSTNVSFSDFGPYTPNTNPLANGSPSDLLPINQQSTTATGAEIYSFNSNTVKATSVTGTSASQAPQINPSLTDLNYNPYLPGSTSALQPTTMALQAPYTQAGNVALPSGAGHFEHLDYGFETKPSSPVYNGMYQNSLQYAIPTGSGFLPPATLPPVSLGSVDINVAAENLHR